VKQICGITLAAAPNCITAVKLAVREQMRRPDDVSRSQRVLELRDGVGLIGGAVATF
jgi:hypothetical protein